MSKKKTLNEADVRLRLITPALRNAGWDEQNIHAEHYLTYGKIIPQRSAAMKRAPRKKADYVLSHSSPRLPLAVVEAKNSALPAADGIQQALEYAEMLDVPFVFSSNGKDLIFHDKTADDGSRETTLQMAQFPSPQTLWEKYKNWKNWDASTEKTCLQDYHYNPEKEPHYYQQTAINRVVEAIAAGNRRALLVMATGTGKTYTAFQIIWRLWKSGCIKRALFLADRELLIQQTRTNDFSPFGGAMARLGVQHGTVFANRTEVDASYEIYLSLYQSITGAEERDKVYKLFSPDFFDLIVVDECHRGSANEDSAWREILEYFSPAAQLGMTATPKETKYTSNIEYFGEPLYSYSLKQGITDGFLAPYKVIRVHIDRDIDGYRPEPGKTDQDNNPVPDRTYHQPDFDQNIVIDDRTKLVAKRISDYLRESGDRMQKTIVFCIDTEHAARMRQALINENTDLCDENPLYVVRITGNDETGVQQLDNFQDPEIRHPVLAVTSRLLSTGVDVPTCRVIVIDKTIGSMTEFKQIVGRGTRLHNDSGKQFFTLLDFRRATDHFSDPGFDGEPVSIYEPREDEPIMPTDDDPPPDNPQIAEPPSTFDPGEATDDNKKIYVNGVPVKIMGEMIKYLDKDGNLITEDLKLYGRNRILSKYDNFGTFLADWNEAERRHTILDELEEIGLPIDDLTDVYGANLDPFDLICAAAFDRPTQTRQERAARARQSKKYTRHGEQARKVLEALLAKYINGNINLFDKIDELQVSPISEIGQPVEIIKLFGGRDGYQKAMRELQNVMYESA